MTDFAKGAIAGFVLAIIIAGVVGALVYFHNRDKEILDYVERQMEIEEMREDIINSDTADFLEIPGVRKSADGASAEFDRKRDEALLRFRSRYADR